MAATLIVKITNGTEIRRFTAQTDNLSWASLSKQTRELFELGLEKPLKLSYVDDEGDRITLSSDAELTEAKELAFKSSPAVLRLTIVHTAPKGGEVGVGTEHAPATNASTQATPESTDRATGGGTAAGAGAQADEMHDFFQNLAKQLPGLVEQLPPGVRNLIPRAELDVAATLAANAAANAPCAAMAAASAACAAAAEARREAAAHANNGTADATGKQDANPTGVHIGVTCDRSGMCPIVGMRYHLVGHNYDLCQNEFDKLDVAEKKLYQKIPPPYVHHIPAEGDSNDPKAATGVHPGVECDRSGMSPIVGMRYHLRGHNYDLCQNEFDKLSAQEKLLYTAIPPPCNGGGGGGGNNNGCANKRGLRGAEFFKGSGHMGPRMGAHGGWGWGGGGCHGWGGGGGGGHGWGGAGGWGGGGPCGGMMFNPAKLAARFVRDVTIFEGTQMAPQTAFTKIWRLKNSGEVAWPPGTRMLFVGGDQMTSEMSVPLSRSTPVEPGEEVDVAVEMVAPSELGRYLGYWRLVGPHGRRKFGQRVWCHVQVVDPSAGPPTLNDADLAAVSAEIERKKSEGLAADDADADDGTDDATDHGGAPSKASSPTPSSQDAGPSSSGLAPADKPLADVAPPAAADVAPTTMDVADVSDPNPTADLKTPPAVPTPVVPSTVVADADADASERASDDGVLVSAADALDASADKTATDAPTSEVEAVTRELASMGFTDPALVAVVLDKNGADLAACARDLAAATEWDALLDDLHEMGFANRELNKTLLLKNSGNVKRTVRELVEDA